MHKHYANDTFILKCALMFLMISPTMMTCEKSIIGGMFEDENLAAVVEEIPAPLNSSLP